MFEELIRLGVLKSLAEDSYEVYDENDRVPVAHLIVAAGDREWLEEFFTQEGLMFWPKSTPANAAARMFITELLPCVADYRFPTVHVGREIDGLFRFEGDDDDD